MHEIDRHSVILSAVQDRSVVTVPDLCTLTGASEATIRRDINTLDENKKLRRVRGGAEALTSTPFVGLAGRPFSYNETLHIAEKQAIAAAAVALCADGEPIIINGGTTTFQMVHPLATTEHLLKNTRNTILLSGGVIYREQNIILSPFDNDVTRNFYAKRMFMGAQGQAEELVVLADSSKFANRSSLILCPLTDITTIITDDGIDDRTAAMLEAADINLVVVSTNTAQKSGAAS